MCLRSRVSRIDSKSPSKVNPPFEPVFVFVFVLLVFRVVAVISLAGGNIPLTVVVTVCNNEERNTLALYVQS